jgi:hypothetical protein
MELLTTSNYKLMKGNAQGYMSFILHLAPADLSGREVCPRRSPGCTAACLNTAGRGKMNTVQAGRLRKTRMFWEERAAFMAHLISDIHAGIRRAEREGMTPCFRLNGTSDIAWEKIRVGNQNLFQLFPDVQFYDYTKVLGRKIANIANYHVTFSRSENNDRDVARAIAQGMNVAVVFDAVPERYLGLPVFNGDDSDLRFLDPSPCIVGLKNKGRARLDDTGFVIHAA